jgi:hypothetical protein
MPNQIAFVTDPVILPVVRGYSNAALIADRCSPLVPVAAAEFRYPVFEKADTYDVVDVNASRTGANNAVEYKSTDQAGLCRPYVLENPVPALDQSQATTRTGGVYGVDPKLRGAQQTMGKIMLARELRVRDLFHTAANYGSNTVTLAGGDQLNNKTTSDPYGVINQAINALILGNTEVDLVFQTSKLVWDAIKIHPQLIEMLYGAGGQKGTVTEKAFAELFGFSDVVIGKAKYNAAKKGQTRNDTWIWGKHISIFNRDMTADTNGGITFSISPEFQKIAQSGFDQRAGAMGVYWYKVGHVSTEVITASDYGYFIQNAIA